MRKIEKNMQQGGFASPYYQYEGPIPSTHASAPPVPVTYSPSDYSNYDNPSFQPPYFENPDHVPNPPPSASTYQHSYQSYNQFHDHQINCVSNSGSTYSDSSYETRLVFDDYGRPINLLNGPTELVGCTGAARTNFVNAIPKMEDPEKAVHNFRVRLLAESANQTDMDVLCEIGLDGIRMLDPATGRNLRIYPLETLTRWEVLDASIFAFWAKSSIDMESRRIRLKSNGCTINAVLDTVTAANVQLEEMGGRHLPSDSFKFSDQSVEKKKGFTDWMKLVKPGKEEKEHWVPDEAVTKCKDCSTDFGPFVWKHHCRNCGDIFCDKCTQGRITLTADEDTQQVRVCDRCMAEVTQRLSHAREPPQKTAGIQSHGNLAGKLKEEMERTRKASLGLWSDGSGVQMREVACPTCTVHLQLQLPTSGSETIECSVCQHPFLVNAH